MSTSTHYLDFAATAAIRPPEVAAAMRDFLDHVGATPGRGSYSRALDAGRMVRSARTAVQRVLGLDGQPGTVVFAANATQALNTALVGCLQGGDVLVVTDFDHNAVRRPALELERRGIELRRVPGRVDGSLDEDRLEAALRGATLMTINAASNLLGTRLPVATLVRRAREERVLTLVDVAQTAGHVADDLTQADLVAFTGHKGLLGPQGVGGLWVRKGCPVRPLLHGGTGGDSRTPEMPEALPDHLEAGTLNAPGISGLLAGIRWVEDAGVDRLHAIGMTLRARLHSGLAAMPGVRVLSPLDPSGIPIVTFVADGIDPGTLAHRLDRDFGVSCRSGLHCAPWAHELLGTTTTGAVRLSLGWCSTEADVDGALEGVERLTASPGIVV